jgi:hypothetical protein
MITNSNGAGAMPPRRNPWQGSPPSALPDINPDCITFPTTNSVPHAT